MRSLLLAAVVFAAGCAGMSDTECRSANWYERGEREALIYGMQPQIEQYAHQCAKHGVQPADQDYMAGWVYGNGERIKRMSGAGCCSPN
jgi:hypothetical protein